MEGLTLHTVNKVAAKSNNNNKPKNKTKIGYALRRFILAAITAVWPLIRMNSHPLPKRGRK
jgi:hypothetical protein